MGNLTLYFRTVRIPSTATPFQRRFSAKRHFPVAASFRGTNTQVRLRAARRPPCARLAARRDEWACRLRAPIGASAAVAAPLRGDAVRSPVALATRTLVRAPETISRRSRAKAISSLIPRAHPPRWRPFAVRSRVPQTCQRESPKNAARARKVGISFRQPGRARRHGTPQLWLQLRAGGARTTVEDGMLLRVPCAAVPHRLLRPCCAQLPPARARSRMPWPMHMHIPCACAWQF